MANEEILGNYRKLEQEIKESRDELRKANDEKEKWFKKKESLKEEIRTRVKEIKEIKNEKDKNNIELFEFKKKRDSYNNEIRKLISEIKLLTKEKEKLFKKYNIKLDPSRIKQQIDELEKKVEVEVSFEKEKKLMDTIKKLKRTFDQSKEIMEIVEKEDKLSEKIDALKKKTHELSEKISTIAHDSSYDMFMAKVKGINEIRKEQEEAFKKFIENKNVYNSINQKLKEKLTDMSKIRNDVEKDKEVIKLKHKEDKQKIIRERVNQVEEKIKKNKKLTTADLIAYQGEDYLEKK